MLIDSGAQDNIIDEFSLQAWPSKPLLRKPSAKLFAYNSNGEMPTIGEFTAKVSFKQKEHTASE
jgi:hypothetical protein